MPDNSNPTGNSEYTDIFGNARSVRYDEAGNRYESYKNLAGETVTFDQKGNTYTSYENMYGETVTRDQQGNAYRTYENMHGEKIVQDQRGNIYRIFNGLFGQMVIHRERHGAGAAQNGGMPNDGNAAGDSPGAAGNGVMPNGSGAPGSIGSIGNSRNAAAGGASGKTYLLMYAGLAVYFLLGLIRIVMVWRSAEDLAVRVLSIPFTMFPVAGDLIIIAVHYMSGNLSAPHNMIMIWRLAVLVLAFAAAGISRMRRST